MTPVPDWPESLESAIASSGLADVGRISFHHHLRSGDRVVGQVLSSLTTLGYKDLTLCASSLIGESGASVLKAIRDGVVSTVETTGLKEPLSSAALNQEIPNPVIFRSHGGRAKAIVSGRTPIDVAFLAVSAVDRYGNANGIDGPNRFGSLGYGLVDAEHAKQVILISDFISEETLDLVSIPADKADQIVIIKSIGDRSRISAGTLRLSKRPIEHLIARRAVEILDACGVIDTGMNFQAGSGGTSLLIAGKTAELMRDRGIRGGFASGGSTGTLASMLDENLFEKIYDVQSFDDEAVLSLQSNPRHIEMSASRYANPDHHECVANELDMMVLSATEVDCDFNVNSLTGSDGRIIGALGGAPDTAAGAGLTMVVLPSMRGRIPSVRERVQTICTPGKTVDIIVTERGFCVNPLRQDLKARLESRGLLPITPFELMDRIHSISGKPDYPERGRHVAGIVEYRDGSILDRIGRILPADN